jgi:cell fate regulator YaaT (PSP1 superfamily)
MNSYDWLGNMSLPGVDMFEVVEVRFKNGRKEFFRNSHRLFLNTGQAVVLEMANGHHIGHVALQGELVRLQMRKRKVAEDSKLPIIYRVATEKDLERYEEVRKREMPAMFRTRQIISDLGLKMKLSDVEYQADDTKATFYYSADDRVDFRELIKVLAGEFKVRVEMRQISLRQEAGRVGGIGSCGRELCCSTWLSEFRSVSTGAARYQNLSLNPTKLSGQCGRLKCCLNYELETYQDALLDIPDVRAPLKTKQGEATLQKVDIFKKILWFSLPDESNWFPVEAARAAMILELNKQGREPDTLMSEEMMASDEYRGATSGDVRRNRGVSKSGTATSITEDAVDRYDDKQGKKRKKKRKKDKDGPMPAARPWAPMPADEDSGGLEVLERLEEAEQQEGGADAPSQQDAPRDKRRPDQKRRGDKRRGDGRKEGERRERRQEPKPEGERPEGQPQADAGKDGGKEGRGRHKKRRTGNPKPNSPDASGDPSGKAPHADAGPAPETPDGARKNPSKRRKNNRRKPGNGAAPPPPPASEG